MPDSANSPEEPTVAKAVDEERDDPAAEPETVTTFATGLTDDGLPPVAVGATSGDAQIAVAGTTDGEVELLVAEADDGQTNVAGALLTDGAWTLLIADFSDKHLALRGYADLREAADASRLRIEGAFVLAKDEDGELTIEEATDLRTRRGLRWGLVTGAVVGIFFPPSLLASLAVGAAVGAGVGRLRHHRVADEFAGELSTVIEPGHSGLVVLASDPAMIELQKALAKADKIVQRAVDKAVVDEITARVQAAEQTESPAGDRA